MGLDLVYWLGRLGCRGKSRREVLDTLITTRSRSDGQLDSRQTEGWRGGGARGESQEGAWIFF